MGIESLHRSWIYVHAAQLTLPFAPAIITAATRGLPYWHPAEYQVQPQRSDPLSKPLPYVTNLQAQSSRVWSLALCSLSAVGEACLKAPKLSKRGKKIGFF